MLPYNIPQETSRIDSPVVLFTSRAHHVRTFLGLLMVLITASGSEKVTINGFLEQNLLLPCSCLRRNMAEEVTWQIEAKRKKIFSYDGNASRFFDGYKDRAKTFLAENNTNCSLLLSNIVLADQGTYMCIFYNPFLSYVHIDLKVSASYSVCQKPDPGEDLNDNSTVRVFQCNATGRFPKSQIQWELDGRPLEKPPTRNTNTTYLNAGLYHLSSTIQVNGSSAPKCVVKNPAVSIHLSYSCSETHHGQQNQTGRWTVISSSVIITIVLLLVCSLVLYCWQTSKGRMKERTAAATNSELMELNMSELHVTPNARI